jgi:hypothetical protein
MKLLFLSQLQIVQKYIAIKHNFLLIHIVKCIITGCVNFVLLRKHHVSILLLFPRCRILLKFLRHSLAGCLVCMLVEMIPSFVHSRLSKIIF